MSTLPCDVCLGGYDGSVEFFSERERKSRKIRKCGECNRDIQAGQAYMALSGKCEGDMWSTSVCVLCYEINTVFSCGHGTEWGGLWDNMEDQVFWDLRVTSPCLHQLSVEARAFLTERWMDWKTR